MRTFEDDIISELAQFCAIYESSVRHVLFSTAGLRCLARYLPRYCDVAC